MRDLAHGSALGRRVFLKQGVLVMTAAAVTTSKLWAQAPRPLCRVALVTELHYADKGPQGSRHYRETLTKLDEAATAFEKHAPDCLIELGDLIDAADTVETEQRYLKTINRAFADICDQRYYVLGNHCVDMLRKDEFLGTVEQAESFFGFDQGGVRFVVLDACFRGDGQPYGRKNAHWTDANIPAAQLEWLQADLQATDKPVVVLAHQRLDVANNHGVKNNAAVRKILEDSGRVLAVFQGHSHKNDLKLIGGIPYCTLVAMVEGSGPENNGYALLEIDPDHTIRLTGFRQQRDYRWV